VKVQDGPVEAWVRRDYVEAASGTPANSGTNAGTAAYLERLQKADLKTYHQLIAINAMLAKLEDEGEDISEYTRKAQVISDRMAARARKIKELRESGGLTSIKSIAAEAWRSSWNWLTSGLSGLGFVPLVIPPAIWVAGGIATMAAGAAVTYWLTKETPHLSAEQDAKLVNTYYSEVESLLKRKLTESEKAKLAETVKETHQEVYEQGVKVGEEEAKEGGIFGDMPKHLKILGLGVLAYLGYEKYTEYQKVSAKKRRKSMFPVDRRVGRRS
jgi:hypothetical protein